MQTSHSMPFGAQVCADGSVRFRLWAPGAHNVQLCLEGENKHHLPLSAVGGGWFELVTRDAAVGSHYRLQINDGLKVPDPASRFQPCDVHGPSQVVDPQMFDWNDVGWRGRRWEEAIIYELHVGAFTPEGTFRGAEQKLDYLFDLGVTAIELMPVSDFPGTRNWGYDGVLPFAPDSCYGRPEDLKRLVQSAHAKGLMILLDVVYNHFGPDGNYLGAYAPQFFTNRNRTPWGDAINFDGPDSRRVRDFFIHNALYWLEEYRFDGLRLDAVHAIFDDSFPDILTELAEAVRARFASERYVHLILENADNAAHYLRRDGKNHVRLYDAQWNDDLHHAVHVLITGETDGYYSDYAAKPMQHLCRCLTEGFSYQGDFSAYHGRKRGESTAQLPCSAFISFLQNHDQIGNRAFGERILQIAPAHAVKAAMEILLLAPAPPMLFMGEEFASDSPFLFFCDFTGSLASTVTAGRRNEFAQFDKFSSPEILRQIPDPNAEQTFLQSKLDWKSLRHEDHARWLDFYRELLAIRQRIIVPGLRGGPGTWADYCSCEGRNVALAWRLADRALLELRANLSDQRAAAAPTHCDHKIYSSGPEAAKALDEGLLPPWSVVWTLGA